MIFYNENDNYFEEFCKYSEYLEELRNNCEEKISNFIDEEWNPKLEYYVECEDSHVLSIMVCDINNKKEIFEQFIINPLCELYDLNVSYVEIVESKSEYIEWGLILKKE